MCTHPSAPVQTAVARGSSETRDSAPCPKSDEMGHPAHRSLHGGRRVFAHLEPKFQYQKKWVQKSGSRDADTLRPRCKLRWRGGQVGHGVRSVDRSEQSGRPAQAPCSPRRREGVGPSGAEIGTESKKVGPVAQTPFGPRATCGGEGVK